MCTGGKPLIRGVEGQVLVTIRPKARHAPSAVRLNPGLRSVVRLTEHELPVTALPSSSTPLQAQLGWTKGQHDHGKSPSRGAWRRGCRRRRPPRARPAPRRRCPAHWGCRRAAAPLWTASRPPPSQSPARAHGSSVHQSKMETMDGRIRRRLVAHSTGILCQLHGRAYCVRQLSQLTQARPQRSVNPKLQGLSNEHVRAPLILPPVSGHS